MKWFIAGLLAGLLWMAPLPGAVAWTLSGLFKPHNPCGDYAATAELCAEVMAQHVPDTTDRTYAENVLSGTRSPYTAAPATHVPVASKRPAQAPPGASGSEPDMDWDLPLLLLEIGVLASLLN